MKNLKKLGQTLTKTELKSICGGKVHASGPPPIPANMLHCYSITYFCNDGIDSHFCEADDEGAHIVGFSAIIPTPAGC